MILNNAIIEDIKEKSSLLFDKAGDFSILSSLIFKETGRNIGVTTLKRLFHYIQDDRKASEYTLNTIALYVGYKSWEEYSSAKNLVSDWGYNDETLYIHALEINTKIFIQYLDRKITFVVVNHEGENYLKVVSSENSSLKITALEHEKLYGIKSVAECLINDAFDYSLKTLMSDMRNIFNREKRELMTKVRHEAENEKSTEIRQSSYTTGWWFWKKTHYRSYEVEVIRAGAVKGLLDNLINDLSNKISLAISESHSKWRQLLQSGIVQAMQDSMPENYESVIITAGDIRMAVIKQVQAFDLEIPDLTCLSYRSIAPDIEKYSGKLEGSEGDSFIDATLDYLNLVGNGFNDYISKYLTSLERQLKDGKNIGEVVFRNLDRRIEAIEEQLKNKEAMLKRFTLLEKDLKSV